MPKLKARLATLAVLAIAATGAYATSFIVPTDGELVGKSSAIVRGVVTSATAVEEEPGSIETLYQVAILRSLKGSLRSGEVIPVRSPGGTTGARFTHVESSAHFLPGEEVLLFLVPHRGAWSPTDMVLGAFRPAVTSLGHSVLVRDTEDIVAWSRDGSVHRETIRREAEFLQFIEDTVAGRPAVRDAYEVEAGDVLPPPIAGDGRFTPETNALFGAQTYSIEFVACNNSKFGGRWTTAVMNAGVVYKKNSAQNLSGAGDGGVSTIENGLAAWTNDCSSAVNITYGGTTATLKVADSENVVVFNDPGGHIAGSWTGSGTIAVAFTSGGSTHTFDGGNFADILDSDIVFQNGYGGAEISLNTAMTHEIGHSIGLRHSNKHFTGTCSITAAPCTLTCVAEPACDPNVSECTTTAIMNSSVAAGLGFTLQTWDQHAANALYPHVCAAFDPPAAVTATATGPTSIQIGWAAVDGATEYEVFRADTVGSFVVSVGSTASTTLTDNSVSSNSVHQYVVRAGDGVTFSVFSEDDIAHTYQFTDPSLAAGTTVRQAHFDELLTVVNAELTFVGQSTIAFDLPLPATTTTVRAAHVNGLRAGIDTIRGTVGAPAMSFTDPTLAAGTAIKAVHLTELRDGIQ